MFPERAAAVRRSCSAASVARRSSRGSATYAGRRTPVVSWITGSGNRSPFHPTIVASTLPCATALVMTPRRASPWPSSMRAITISPAARATCVAWRLATSSSARGR